MAEMFYGSKPVTPVKRFELYREYFMHYCLQKICWSDLFKLFGLTKE